MTRTERKRKKSEGWGKPFQSHRFKVGSGSFSEVRSALLGPEHPLQPW